MSSTPKPMSSTPKAAAAVEKPKRSASAGRMRSSPSPATSVNNAPPSRGRKVSERTSQKQPVLKERPAKTASSENNSAPDRIPLGPTAGPTEPGKQSSKDRARVVMRENRRMLAGMHKEINSLQSTLLSLHECAATSNSQVRASNAMNLSATSPASLHSSAGPATTSSAASLESLASKRRAWACEELLTSPARSHAPEAQGGPTGQAQAEDNDASDAEVDYSSDLDSVVPNIELAEERQREAKRQRAHSDPSMMTPPRQPLGVEDSVDDLFRVEVCEGEQFMCVKPWMGALFAPEGFVENENDMLPPPNTLTLDWVHGYRGHDCRDNLFYTHKGELVYTAAACGVVYDKTAHSQKHFIAEDDLLCLAIHPDGNVAATGEIGKRPPIYCWSTDTMEIISTLKNGHERAVVSCTFMNDGRRLVSVGFDDFHTVVVWDWKTATKLTDSRGGPNKLLLISASPFDETVVTLGLKHIKFWHVHDRTLEGDNGVFGKLGTPQVMLSCEFLKAQVTLTGVQDGSIYTWMGKQLTQAIQAHRGPVFDLFADGDSVDEMRVASGGSDGNVKLWLVKGTKLNLVDTINLNEVTAGQKSYSAGKKMCVRSINWVNGILLIGTRGNAIYEIDLKTRSAKLWCQGHSAGEVWALDTHPFKNQYCTAADDGSVRVWDIATKSIIHIHVMDYEIRSVGYSPCGKYIAVGLRLAHGFMVFTADLAKRIIHRKNHAEDVDEVKYSPDGELLAVGSRDNWVTIYDVKKNYKRIKTFKGHTSYITHVDWAADSNHLQTTCGAYELLFWSISQRSQVTKASSFKDFEWASWTCTLGWPVQGIYPPFADGTDVNSCDRSKNRKVIACSDDFGCVTLYRYPCYDENARGNSYHGHSSHVTCCRWTHNDSYLCSVGGGDLCIMRWKHHGPGITEAAPERSDSPQRDPQEMEVLESVSKLGSTVSKKKGPTIPLPASMPWREAKEAIAGFAVGGFCGLVTYNDSSWEIRDGSASLVDPPGAGATADHESAAPAPSTPKAAAGGEAAASFGGTVFASVAAREQEGDV